MASVDLIPRLKNLAEKIDEKVNFSGDSEGLVPFLNERSEMYAGCNSREVIRLRSNILSRFEVIGLPDSALPFVLEELESGHDPTSIAAAASALRGYEMTSPDFVPFVLSGLQNLQGHDDLVSFELCLGNEQQTKTTAQSELTKTLQWLEEDAWAFSLQIEELARQNWNGLAKETREALQLIADKLKNQKTKPANSCCTGIRKIARFSSLQSKNSTAFQRTEFQDQDGKTTAFSERIKGGVTILAFFYTRCENPRKCSLTISKLAKVQKAFSQIEGCRVNIIAVSYDPKYDLPHRMKMFGADRGLKFDERCSLLRAVSEHDEFIESLNVQVNYADSLVNHHALELMMFDKIGRLSRVYSRVQWEPAEIVNRAIELSEKLDRKSSIFSRKTGLVPAFCSATIIALMPKCPLCWAAYLSFFGITATQSFLSRGSVLGIAFACLFVFLVVIVRRGFIAKTWIPFVVSAIGAVGLFIAMPLELHWSFRAASLAFLMLGSFLSANFRVPVHEYVENQA